MELAKRRAECIPERFRHYTLEQLQILNDFMTKYGRGFKYY